jgi:hypothetical protein
MVGRIHGLQLPPGHPVDRESFVSQPESGLIEDTIDTLYETATYSPLQLISHIRNLSNLVP